MTGIGGQGVRLENGEVLNSNGMYKSVYMANPNVNFVASGPNYQQQQQQYQNYNPYQYDHQQLGQSQYIPLPQNEQQQK